MVDLVESAVNMDCSYSFECEPWFHIRRSSGTVVMSKVEILMYAFLLEGSHVPGSVDGLR